MPAFSILIGELNDVFNPQNFSDPNYSLEDEILPISLYFLCIQNRGMGGGKGARDRSFLIKKTKGGGGRGGKENNVFPFDFSNMWVSQPSCSPTSKRDFGCGAESVRSAEFAKTT